MRIAIFATGLLVGALVLGVLLLDEGEVVTLTTHGQNGTTYDTQLWLVEADGRLYVRARAPDAEWLMRVRDRNEVTLRRGDETHRYRAHPESDPAVRAAVTRAMQEKYGVADRVFAVLADEARAVPVRLELLGLAQDPEAAHPAAHP